MIYCHSTNLNYAFGAIAIFIFGSGVLSLYFVNPFLIKKTEAVNTAWNNLINPTEYEQIINYVTCDVPYISFSATGSYSISEYESASCESKEIKFNITNYSSNYDIAEYTKDSYFQFNFLSDETPEQKEFITKFADLYSVSLPQTSSKNGKTILWNLAYGVKIDSITTSKYFVTKDGKLEGQYSPTIGKTMMAFWSGIGYVYRLASMPVRYSTIAITNITFEIPSETDEFWGEVHNVKCM